MISFPVTADKIKLSFMFIAAVDSIITRASTNIAYETDINFQQSEREKKTEKRQMTKIKISSIMQLAN